MPDKNTIPTRSWTVQTPAGAQFRIHVDGERGAWWVNNLGLAPETADYATAEAFIAWLTSEPNRERGWRVTPYP